MTLIVHIPAKNGLVMASDGQATTEEGLKIKWNKIHKLNESCIWGASSDDLSLIDRVEEGIVAMPDKEKPLQDLCLTLHEIVPKCVEELLPPQQKFEPYEALFTFLEYRDNPRVLYVRENGTTRWRANVPFAIGSGSPFAFALLQKYQDLIIEKIDINLAAVLAYKIIAETIEVTEGVGYPIDVWQLPPAKNLTKEELTGLEETYLGLRKAEIEMFLGSTG